MSRGGRMFWREGARKKLKKKKDRKESFLREKLKERRERSESKLESS